MCRAFASAAGSCAIVLRSSLSFATFETLLARASNFTSIDLSDLAVATGGFRVEGSGSSGVQRSGLEALACVLREFRELRQPLRG
jgi:hypothetical protein